MNFPDRIGWLVLGSVIGFLFGYIVRYLQEIKEELHEVDEIMREHVAEDNTEAGWARTPMLMDIALAVVVILTVWAAVSSQIASRGVKETQANLRVVSACNQHYLVQTVEALHERTTFTKDQAQANIELQKAQSDYFRFLLKKPPYPLDQQSAAAQVYLDALTKFVSLSLKTSAKAAEYPFPDENALQTCYTK